MKWRTPERRPYYAKYERVAFEHDAGWFECYRLPDSVFAICEPQHLQEVNMFLIVGDDRALLLDTGLGMCDVKAVVDELYQGPLQVINCHRHFDHTGNNWRFPEVLAADAPGVAEQAATGIPHEFLANQTDPDMFLFDFPAGLDPDTFCVRPYRVRPVADGHVFDLGGREIEVVYTPGHTEDSLMLYDRTHDILFGGDMVYLAAIYVEFDNDFMGHSDIAGYIESLRMLEQKFPQVKTVYASHNDFVVDPEAIPVLREALQAVHDGVVQGEPLSDPKWGYWGDPEVLAQYFFDGFSVIARQGQR
ncbi:MBL fold metallo-hydrolase [Slackia heliotrinireducens]|uniref:MBL fold metallo-hydrolase n=1 Tax=Slackia heliotrinireducens TaxID=84110 RepID=UPI0033161845